MRKLDKKEAEAVTDFLFEAGMLSKTPRSGFFFLGSGEQSVAEHTNRVCFVGLALSKIAEDVDIEKVLKMCLFHDLAETRVSDLNYVHQKYTDRHEDRATEDLTAPLFFGESMREILKEYEKRESREAKIAKDADNIELILSCLSLGAKPPPLGGPFKILLYCLHEII